MYLSIFLVVCTRYPYNTYLRHSTTHKHEAGTISDYTLALEQGELHITCPRSSWRDLDALTHVLFEQGATLSIGLLMLIGDRIEITLQLNPTDERSLEAVLRYISDTTHMMLIPAS